MIGDSHWFRPILLITTTLGLTLSEPVPAAADQIRDAEWYLSSLDLLHAQKISPGHGVVVAVIDTGLAASIKDLLGNVLPGADAITGLVGAGQESAEDHGTSVASIVAAHGTGFNDGLLGVAPEAKILPIEVSVNGLTDPIALRKAVPWAVKHGAQVICIARGVTPSDALEKEIDDALTAGTVIVAAAGNLPGSTSVAYPAAYPGVIAVAGVDRNGNHADFSVTGPEVALSAPAVDIVSVNADGRYIKSSGTSDATAIVAGVVALVRARFPDLSVPDIIRRLTATATDRGPPGRDDQYGYGIVNPVAALTADLPPSPVQTRPPHMARSVAVPQTQPSPGPGIALPVLAGITTLIIFVSAGILIARRRTPP